MPARPWPLVAALLWAPLAAADYMDHFVVREDIGLHKAPSLGPAKLLLIPVEVKGHPPIDLEALRRFFSPDDPGGFVAYFRTASLGRYLPEVTVAPKLLYSGCPLPESIFPGCVIRRGDIAAFSHGMTFMREVIQATDQGGMDFSAFDVNGRRGEQDGYVDGVMLLTNVPFGGIAFPFAFFNREDNLAGEEGGPLVVDGTRISHFAIAGDSDPYVMVHEFGHLLGLTDLYDESGTYDGLHLSFMGAWSYDPAIPLPDAETRYRLRWADVIQVQGGRRYRLGPAERTGEVYRLGTGEEYFLVENRGPGGAFDGEFEARGLVAYHVDRTVKLRGEEGRFVDRSLDCVNCDPFHPYIRLIQADGRFELQEGGAPDYGEDLFRDGDALGPDPSGEPLSESHLVQSTNLYSGEQTGWVMRDVVVLPDGTIEATFEGREVDPCADPLCAEGVACRAVNCGQPAPSEVRGCGCGAGDGALGLWGLLALCVLGRGQGFFRKRASAAESRSPFAGPASTPPSPIWKKSQKLAASLSRGGSEKGSLHCLATPGSKCRQWTQACNSASHPGQVSRRPT